MADSRILLKGLEDYAAVLDSHSTNLNFQFNDLDSRWRTFSTVYEGEAADQFRAGWTRTAQNFQEYIQQTDRIRGLLRERIEALREADRAESGLI
ncbi:MAG: WXG100 family type VII secretion target [Pyrinomonadaceae bacterium]